MSGTNTKDKTSSIDHLDFGVTCDYMNCEGVATHRLICPECSLFEFMCDPHTKAAKLAKKGSWIVFDKSCKHRVDMFHCGKEPI
jgi:hypothetical protein